MAKVKRRYGIACKLNTYLTTYIGRTEVVSDCDRDPKSSITGSLQLLPDGRCNPQGAITLAADLVATRNPE